MGNRVHGRCNRLLCTHRRYNLNKFGLHLFLAQVGINIVIS